MAVAPACRLEREKSSCSPSRQYRRPVESSGKGRQLMKLLVATVFALGFALSSGSAEAQQFEAQPAFDNCKDDSLQRAMTEGITLGISPSPPYSSIDPNSKQAEGLDVEINETALKWLGISKIDYEVAPFGQLIPAMLAGRIDVVASNIHIPPDRLKVVAFTTPAVWYGRAIVVPKGNPEGNSTFTEMQGK